MNTLKYICFGIVGNIIIGTLIKIADMANPTWVTMIGVMAWTIYTLCLRHEEERKTK